VESLPDRSRFEFTSCRNLRDRWEGVEAESQTGVDLPHLEELAFWNNSEFVELPDLSHFLRATTGRIISLLCEFLLL
jgi:hypothetical protein